MRNDEELAQAIVDSIALDTYERLFLVDTFLQVGEWAQAATQALLTAIEHSIPVDPDLIQQATFRWLEDMGPDLAERITVYGRSQQYVTV